MHVVVIGGGLAGLASAVELRNRGADVTLIEANTHLGGKMNVLSEAGFTFDMGPTILTLPEVLCGIIRRSGRRVEDLIDLVRLDPQWRCHYEDGTVLDLKDGVDEMATYLDEVFQGSGAGAEFRSFLAYARRMNRLSRSVFFYRDLGNVMDVIRASPKSDPAVMWDAMAMRLHSTVAATVAKHIHDPRVRQLVEHFLQYVGSSPFLAPAILTMIASVQLDQGCWYAMGGTRMVARALERLARESGVDCRTGVRVSSILHTNGRATGVRLESGEEICADAVVSNCDVQRTLTNLIDTPAAHHERRSIARKYTPACSGVVLYLGLNRQYDHLAHHNFIFSQDSHEEFDDIYKRGIPARDPTLYIAAPSRTDPDQAPSGCEALYILVHTPYIREGSIQSRQDEFIRAYRPVIMEKLSRFGMADIQDHIVVERSLLPRGIERMYNAEGGAIYGLTSHGRLHGGFKPRNTSQALERLYLAGGSVNPGPGVPMVLMSGVTAADAVARDLGLERPNLQATSAPPGTGEFRFVEETAAVG
ncbi:MAG: phytoene desaturase [Planctomycetota bacterium]|nr:MAG: phytoene desaturase [Planctomycetota bacterium]